MDDKSKVQQVTHYEAWYELSTGLGYFRVHVASGEPIIIEDLPPDQFNAIYSMFNSQSSVYFDGKYFLNKEQVSFN